MEVPYVAPEHHVRARDDAEALGLECHAEEIGPREETENKAHNSAISRNRIR